MKYLIKFDDYKIFETISNFDIFKEISSYSYLIEDKGFKIVYFAKFEHILKKERDFDFSIGSTDDTEYRSYIFDDKKWRLKKISLEIVDELPRKKSWEEIIDELNKNGLFDYMTNSFKLIFPEYDIEKSKSGTPFIFIDVRKRL